MREPGIDTETLTGSIFVYVALKHRTAARLIQSIWGEQSLLLWSTLPIRYIIRIVITASMMLLSMSLLPSFLDDFLNDYGRISTYLYQYHQCWSTCYGTIWLIAKSTRLESRFVLSSSWLHFQRRTLVRVCTVEARYDKIAQPWQERWSRRKDWNVNMKWVVPVSEQEWVISLWLRDYCLSTTEDWKSRFAFSLTSLHSWSGKKPFHRDDCL